MMEKNLTIAEQRSLCHLESRPFTYLKIPFNTIKTGDLGVVITERGCGYQYPLATIALTSILPSSHKLRGGKHYFFCLNSGLVILREFRRYSTERVIMTGTDDGIELEIEAKEISTIYKIKSLYYRSDM